MTRITDIEQLLFPVKLLPVFTEIESNGELLRVEVPNSRIIINCESRRPLGVVSNNYRIITNLEAIELGKKCARELFEGSISEEDIEIFNIDAPATASYCHIDLVHKGYVMNLYDEENQSDIYIPYIRVTNSYNTSRALRFDIGFCRKICLNGMIFESETIKFTFFHLRHKLNEDNSFSLEQGKIKVLFGRFVAYMDKIKVYSISRNDSIEMIKALFGIKDESEMDFNENDEIERGVYLSLIKEIEEKLNKYVGYHGENGYSLFNTITDIASHPIKNRYFHRDINSMQRLAGGWVNSFQREIEKPDFDIAEYIRLLKESPNKRSYLNGNTNGSAEQAFV